MKLLVLSDKGQCELFVKHGYRFSDFQIISDNPRFYEYLNTRKISFEKIDEFLIEPQWKPINAWASDSINAWSEFCREKKLFSEVNWCSAIRHALTCILIQIVKNRKIAEIILDRYRPHEMIGFKTQNVKNFPFFSGNVCLNAFLIQLAAERNIKVVTLDTNTAGSEVLKGDFPVPGSWYKSILKTLKLIPEAFCRLFMGRFGYIDFIAFGSLRHLSSVLKELKYRGAKIAIYDFEYHGEQFLFAVKNRIKYYLPPFFLNEDKIASQQTWASLQYSEFLNAFQKGCSEGLFYYEGYDYGNMILRQVLLNMERYFLKMSKEQAIYQTILESSHCKAWVVDDDFAAKGGFIAAFLNAHATDVYCLSHANLVVNFAVPRQRQSFAQSTTFVHTEHEKNMYTNRGWDPNSIVATGSPRHDRIFQILHRKKSRGEKNRKFLKLLFQAAHIWPSSPDLRGYLGCHITNTGDLQASAFRKIVNAMAGLPIELIVKPHDAESVMSWKNFVKNTDARNKITITKHSEDFLKLLANSDGMISGCWSTTLIEAALFHKPSFFVTGKPIPNLELEQFTQNGFCQIFDEVDQLYAAFQRLCDIGSNHYFESIPKTKELFYLSYQDGQNTRRVVDFMLNKTPLNTQG